LVDVALSREQLSGSVNTIFRIPRIPRGFGGGLVADLVASD